MAHTRWNSKEVEHLCRWYNIKPIQELCEDLKRTNRSVMSKAEHLGLQQSNKRWTSWQENVILTQYKTTTAKHIARLVHRSANAVHRRAAQLGCRKHKDC
jgi:hypothetical protein